MKSYLCLWLLGWLSGEEHSTCSGLAPGFNFGLYSTRYKYVRIYRRPLFWQVKGSLKRGCVRCEIFRNKPSATHTKSSVLVIFLWKWLINWSTFISAVTSVVTFIANWITIFHFVNFFWWLSTISVQPYWHKKQTNRQTVTLIFKRVISKTKSANHFQVGKRKNKYFLKFLPKILKFPAEFLSYWGLKLYFWKLHHHERHPHIRG